MNCEQFELTVLAEPHTDSAECAEHARECEDCRGLQDKALRLDARLQQSLQVSVPASLSKPLPDMASVAAAESDPVSNVVSLDTKRSKSRFAVPTWAIAACVALIALIVVRQQDVASDQATANTEALTAEVIEHLGPEISTMRLVDSRVTATKLDSVLKPAGAQLASGSDSVISYAKSCLINGKLVPHLVVQGENGPVTVLLMPGESVDGPVSIMRDGLEGVILPVGDGGSVAIIGRDKASVEAVRQQTQSSVSFSI